MKFLLALIFGIFATQALAYPIMFSCEGGSINSEARFNENDLFEKYMRLEKEKRSSFVESICQGSKTCMRDFDAIVKAAGSSVEIAQEMFNEKLNEIKSDYQKLDITGEELEQYLALRESHSKIMACQNAKASLSPEDFLVSNDNRVLTTYPFWNDYTFTSICPQAIDETKQKGAGFCGPIDKGSLNTVIEESILMGVDPYLVLSLSMMEGGSGNVGSLYLDPIGVMGAMGCSSKQVANNTDSNKALNSYGTSYVVNADIKKDPKLQKKLKAYFKHFQPENIEDGESYYCYNVLGQSSPTIYDSPQQDSCCVDLGFSAQSSSSSAVSHALTYHFIDKITRNKFRGKDDPAWRAQRYNGYTNLMGAAEGVSAWRAGVNYYENPAYGYQTMDYMLNSLMFNPYIRSKVEEFGEGKEWDSLLCEDKADGVYTVDSDRYFNKHRDSQRLKVIEEKYKAGKGYSSLSSREKRIMDQELSASAKLNKAVPTTLDYQKAFELQNKLSMKLFSQETPEVKGGGFGGWGGPPQNEIFKKTALSKEEWKKDIADLHNFSEEKLDIIYAYQEASVEMIKKRNEIDKKRGEALKELEDFCKIEDNASDCEEYKDVITNYAYYWGEGNKKVAPIKFQGIMSKIYDFKEEEKLNNKKMEEIYQSYEIFNNSSPQEWESLNIIGNKYHKLETLDEAIERYSSNKNFTPELKKDLELYHQHLSNDGKGYDKEKAYQEYFKSVYQKRKNIGGASEFPWRRLSDEEVEKAASYFSSLKDGSYPAMGGGFMGAMGSSAGGTYPGPPATGGMGGAGMGGQAGENFPGSGIPMSEDAKFKGF